MKIYKNTLKVIIIMLLIITCFLSSNKVYARPVEGTDGAGGSSGTSIDENSSEDPIENPDFYMPTDTTGNNTKFIEMGNVIIGTIRVLGTAIAVIALMVIGLRYMFGSTADRANYKETMIPYLIGAVMIFTIPNIVGIIYDLVKAMQF